MSKPTKGKKRLTQKMKGALLSHWTDTNELQMTETVILKYSENFSNIEIKLIHKHEVIILKSTMNALHG